jgi:hypothetical protein
MINNNFSFLFPTAWLILGIYSAKFKRPCSWNKDYPELIAHSWQLKTCIALTYQNVT